MRLIYSVWMRFVTEVYKDSLFQMKNATVSSFPQYILKVCLNNGSYGLLFCIRLKHLQVDSLVVLLGFLRDSDLSKATTLLLTAMHKQTPYSSKNERTISSWAETTSGPEPHKNGKNFH